MASIKGPQIYLNDQEIGEKAILDWANSLGKGRKSAATTDLVILGLAVARASQPIADLIVAASRRGESLTLDQIDDYIAMFRSHSMNKTTIDRESSVSSTSKQSLEKEGKIESQRESNSFDDLGG